VFSLNAYSLQISSKRIAVDEPNRCRVAAKNPTRQFWMPEPVRGIVPPSSRDGKACPGGDRFAKSITRCSENQQLNKAGYYERFL
jgi:hypothetical protein